MILKRKTVGAIVGGLLAICFAGGSSASADSGLTLGPVPVTITGTQSTTQSLKLTASGINVKCTTSNLTAATATGTTISELTAKPTYAGCMLGGLFASVIPNACEYTLTSTATSLVANVDVVNCAAGAPITITQGTCVITIGNQGPLSSITLANQTESSPHDVGVTLNVKEIAYTGGSGCPANIKGERKDGTLTGGSTLRAYVDAGGTHGAQLSLTAH